MIELSEEPYDGDVAAGFIAALLADLNERYADDLSGMTPDEEAEDVAAYLAEVTPDMVDRPQGAFVVARLDGQVVGCGAVKPLHGQAGTAEVKRMYMAPNARRRGVSRAILTRLEEIAAELGYRSLRLETGTQQPEAVALYESAGWHRVEPYGRYRESPWSICLAKDLVAP